MTSTQILQEANSLLLTYSHIVTMDTFHNTCRIQLEAERLDLHGQLEDIAQYRAVTRTEIPETYVTRPLSKLARICAALKRMESGTFGVCLACKQKITTERLKQMAYAELCWACRRQQEAM